MKQKKAKLELNYQKRSITHLVILQLEREVRLLFHDGVCKDSALQTFSIQTSQVRFPFLPLGQKKPLLMLVQMKEYDMNIIDIRTE